MRDFYPAISPYREGFLQVSSLHKIFFEECGNPQGLPVVFLHGGPGGGIAPNYRQFFNPDSYRIVLFDQRGCGKSLPFSELRENTTWDLVADMEKLREHLKIEKWVVFGGSWGSTLALSYAVTHPENVLALVLRGIFLLRQKEIQWFYQFGASELFPDIWEQYSLFIPEEERHDYVSAYYRRLTSEDSEVRKEAAKRWSIWEGATSKLFIDPDMLERFGEDRFADAFARIECHYFMNKGFFERENFLLDECSKIQHIPTSIIQGRYDVVCPMVSAWELSKCLPQAKLIVVPDAGHSALEKGNRMHLIAELDRYAKELKIN